MANAIAFYVGYWGFFALCIYGIYRLSKWAIVRTIKEWR